MNGAQRNKITTMIESKNYYKIYIFTVITSVIMIFSAKNVFAATAYVSSVSESANIGDTVSVEVRLNTQNEAINVVEGEIDIGNAALIDVRELSVSGSNIIFWSRKPSLSVDKKTISFVGGVPGGFNLENGLLFKIYFKTNNAGEIVLTPRDIKSYINDGKGTVADQSTSALTFKINSSVSEHGTDEWNKIVSSDNMPPEFLAADVGRDASLFENKLFLTINATDYQSGIDHFEIKEGDLQFVRSGSVYVLQDQTQKSVVIINAYDKSGNVRTLIIKPYTLSEKIRQSIIYIAAGLLLALIIVLTTVIIRKNRKS
jgi:hypothetical protein